VRAARPTTPGDSQASLSSTLYVHFTPNLGVSTMFGMPNTLGLAWRGREPPSAAPEAPETET